MVPPGSSQGMAELMTTYKHIMGSDKSQKMAQTMGSGSTERILQQITQDLEDMKRQQAGGLEMGKAKGDQYKYLDDKNLYSTDG